MLLPRHQWGIVRPLWVGKTLDHFVGLNQIPENRFRQTGLSGYACLMFGFQSQIPDN